MSPLETRLSLIVKLKNEQSEVAWRDFVVTYELFLQQLAHRQGVPERHVPDVTQQVLLAIAKSIDQWQDDGTDASFRRWLTTVARNVAIRFMSRERKQIGAVGGTDWVALLQNVAQQPNEDSVKRYQHELIVWAASQIRQEFLETSWRAFWSTVIEGRPVDQVAEELGVTAGSIYMSRSRIMSRIKQKVQEIDLE